MKVAVIGHVEWADFAMVDRVPRQGEIVHAAETWEVPAGGGAVAAVQIAKLNGGCHFFTAVGSDHRGQQVPPVLEAMGLTVDAAHREGTQRRAFVYLDAENERTITTLGERVFPRVDDQLAWDELDGTDAVYVTAADAAGIRAARSAKKVVATVRVGEALAEAGVKIDALVASANDRGELYVRGGIEPSPEWVVRTDGSRGGTLESVTGEVNRWDTIAPPGPPVDSYGAGDSFAGGLTYGLACGFSIDRAIAVGAFCGAHAVTGRGPYAGHASAAEFSQWERSRS